MIQDLLPIYCIVVFLLFFFEAPHDLEGREFIGAVLLWPIYFPLAAIVGLFRRTKN